MGPDSNLYNLAYHTQTAICRGCQTREAVLWTGRWHSGKGRDLGPERGVQDASRRTISLTSQSDFGTISGHEPAFRRPGG
jgi:hypothetical protein